VGAAADGAFVNYGLGAQHVSRVRGLIAEGAAGARRPASEIDVWSIACLDVAERREDALEKLGNILGFVAAYILEPDPAGRGVPPELLPAVHELRATYSTRQLDMDPALTRRLGLFDYLRARLAIAGTPDDCVARVRAAEAARVTQLMLTVSLAADPERTVELFGKAVQPRFSCPG
jgi:alkanesulfonate monooxygenase SsuD/methylene tetrahydromethanopterin reductase-like flavin-dependent oxidoreductase (luciferase family)